jgi:mono/diheme cytochrome c family protein
MRNYIIYSLFIVCSVATIFSACLGADSVKYQRYYADGSQVYKVHCQNCHMADGQGLAQLIPPLNDSTFLRKNRAKLACYIVYGLNDSIKINGIDYQFAMPAEKHLAPIDLAKVLTYITNSFGNKQGIFDVKEVDQNLNNCQ